MAANNLKQIQPSKFAHKIPNKKKVLKRFDSKQNQYNIALRHEVCDHNTIPWQHKNTGLLIMM